MVERNATVMYISVDTFPDGTTNWFIEIFRGIPNGWRQYKRRSGSPSLLRAFSVMHKIAELHNG